jgi:DNA polymerase
MSIADKLSAHPVPEQVWEEYWMDQAINDRGILVALPMVRSAIALDAKSKRNLKKEMREITSLANPQSVQQMQQWLRENGVELDSLGKKEIAAQLDGIEEPMRSVLLLRQELAMAA